MVTVKVTLQVRWPHLWSSTVSVLTRTDIDNCDIHCLNCDMYVNCESDIWQSTVIMCSQLCMLSLPMTVHI